MFAILQFCNFAGVEMFLLIFNILIPKKMKKKMIFAFVATMSFLAPNLADAATCTADCGVSCKGAECYATEGGVTCKNGNVVTVKVCPRTVAGM